MYLHSSHYFSSFRSTLSPVSGKELDWRAGCSFDFNLNLDFNLSHIFVDLFIQSPHKYLGSNLVLYCKHSCFNYFSLVVSLVCFNYTLVDEIIYFYYFLHINHSKSKTFNLNPRRSFMLSRFMSVLLTFEYYYDSSAYFYCWFLTFVNCYHKFVFIQLGQGLFWA